MNQKLKTTDIAETTSIAGVQSIVEAIRAEMSEEGGLPAERKLADKLGVKRHQLRSALKILREGGEVPLPRPRARRSASVARTSDLVRNTNPVEVVELRIMIEPTLARLAALRATPNMIVALQRAVEDIAEGEAKAKGVDLHRMIAEAAGNGLALEFHSMLRRIECDVRLNSDVGEGLNRDTDTDQHKAIVAAIASRAPEEAERAMRAHLTSVHRMLLGGLE